MLTKRAVTVFALTFRSSHAVSRTIRFFAASHFCLASSIDGLCASTARVTSTNERREPSSAPHAVRSDKLERDKSNKRIVVFIDPGQRLKRRRAGEWAHHGRQRPWIR